MCLWNFDSIMSTSWDTCTSGLTAATFEFPTFVLRRAVLGLVPLKAIWSETVYGLVSSNLVWCTDRGPTELLNLENAELWTRDLRLDSRLDANDSSSLYYIEVYRST